MTATDVLRRLLDERGVEYDTRDGKAFKDTYWDDGHGRRWGYTEDVTDGGITSPILFHVSGQLTFTPERAIAATLGSSNCTDDERTNGTCHDLAITPNYRDKTEFKCSECGYEYSAVGGFGCDSGDEPDFNYCPNCGRKVVDA